jgi:hypothetical protein
MADTPNEAGKQAWVLKVLGHDFQAAGGGGLKQAQAQWTQRRSAVVADLAALEKAIRGMEHPRADDAIILVKAISANLTVAPDSKRSVAELRRYLETDSIIDDAEMPNGFGIDVKIRAPLMPALEALDHVLAD